MSETIGMIERDGIDATPSAFGAPIVDYNILLSSLSRFILHENTACLFAPRGLNNKAIYFTLFCFIIIVRTGRKQ